MFSDRASNLLRRNLRMASGLILFVYIGSHLLNHALGLVSLQAAERLFPRRQARNGALRIGIDDGGAAAVQVPVRG